MGVLVGIPGILGGGLMGSIVGKCKNYYNTASDSMCKESFEAFIELCAIWLISVVAGMLLVVLGWLSSIPAPSSSALDEKSPAPMETNMSQEYSDIDRYKELK